MEVEVEIISLENLWQHISIFFFFFFFLLCIGAEQSGKQLISDSILTF